MNHMIFNSRIFLSITGLWLSLGLATLAIADPDKAPSLSKAQAALELPSLNQSFKGARA
jgi:hypothetical protein